MTDDDLLAELLLRWEELHEHGQDTSVEVLCADSPHLTHRLENRIRALKATAWMDDPFDADEEPSLGPDGPDGPNDPEEPPRTLAGRYRLDEKIAEGGFSRVWKGYDPELRRAVAVKLPKRSGTVSAEGFLAEARRVASLRHPGVVPVFDVGLHDGSFFIVSEYVEGGSLADRIRRERLDPQRAVRLIVGIAETLAYAHEQGFIHRDIKPGNILLDHHGRALLADFGISSSPGETGEAEGFGTLAYMSPERVGGESTDARSDLYSLGVVLYEVLTGRLPYSATDPAALRRQILRNPPAETAEIAEFSARLAGVCRKCLSTDPSARHLNAAELAAELRGCLEPRSFGKAMGFLWAAPVLLTLAGAIAVGWQFRPIPSQEAIAAPVVPAPSWERVAVIGGRDVLHLPVGIVWDRDGNLIVANSGAGRLTVMDRTGKVLRALCQEGRLPHQILYPHYICLTSRGHLVVSDFGNHRIQVFDPDGNWIRSVGGKGKEPGRFDHPRGSPATGTTTFTSPKRTTTGSRSSTLRGFHCGCSAHPVTSRACSVRLPGWPWIETVGSTSAIWGTDVLRSSSGTGI